MRTEPRGTTWALLRLVVAALILAAIVAQLAKSIGTAAELDRDVVTTAANFFSFFTILSNLATAIVLAWAGTWFLAVGRRGSEPQSAEPPALALCLAAVTTYMLVTGIVYNTLLRSVELPQGAAPIPWSNEVLHLIAPLFMLADLLLAPRRRALPWGAVWAVLVLPLGWIAYTTIRGPLVVNPITGAPYWYPYPFLDPHSPATGGYVGVIAYVAAIATLIAAAAILVVWWGRRRAAKAVAGYPSTGRSAD